MALANLARTLYVPGEIGRLEGLLDATTDELGIQLADEQLPKRVRARKSSGAM